MGSVHQQIPPAHRLPHGRHDYGYDTLLFAPVLTFLLFSVEDIGTQLEYPFRPGPYSVGPLLASVRNTDYIVV